MNEQTGLSWVYVQFGTIPWIAAIFYGLKPAVLAIVATAVLRIGAVGPPDLRLRGF